MNYRPSLLILAGLAAGALALPSHADDDGFIPLTDGSFKNWRAGENTNTWTLVDGAFQAHGDRSHLFYVGPEAPFKDYILELDIKTAPGSNGGVYVSTKYQAEGWPWGGYEIQVNNTHSDWRKTASVYAVQDVKDSPAVDNQWWHEKIVVKGRNIKIYVDGKLANDFTEEADRKAGADFQRKLTAGTIALQGHDPKSVVQYKNIRIKKLD